MANGVTFSPAAAAKIKRATERVLNSPPSRTGDRTQSTSTDSTFWALITGVDVSGLHFTFVRVIPTFAADAATDFRLTNGTAYRIHDAEDERSSGVAREANGNKSVPTETVVMMSFMGYDRDGEPAYIFQYAFDPDVLVLPHHDHRDNLSGGFAFACYHPGTGLPQQPWAQ